MSQPQPPPLPPPGPEPFRLPGFVKWTLVGLGLLVLLLVVGWIVLDASADRRLRETLAALERDGYSVRFTDLAPKPVPAGEEATALLLEAFSLMESIEDARMLDIDAEKPYAVMTGEERERTRSHLEACGDVLAKVAKATRGPLSPIPRDTAQGIHLEIRDISGSRGVVHTLARHARMAAGEGRPGEAVESVRRIFAVADLYAEDPYMVCQLVRVAYVATGLQAIDDCVPAGRPAEELRKWRAIVPDPRRFDGFAERCLRGELAWAIPILQNPGQANVTLGEEVAVPGAIGPLWKIGTARYLDRMRRVIDACAEPYPQARTELQAVEDELQNLGVVDLVTSLLMPSMSGVLDRQAETQARLAVVRTGLDFEIAFARNGAYPDKASEIDPYTGDPVLVDGVEGTIHAAGPGSTISGRTLRDGTWTLRQTAGKKPE